MESVGFEHLRMEEVYNKRTLFFNRGICLAHPQFFWVATFIVVQAGRARGPSCPNRHNNWEKGPIFKTGGGRGGFARQLLKKISRVAKSIFLGNLLGFKEKKGS